MLPSRPLLSATLLAAAAALSSCVLQPLPPAPARAPALDGFGEVEMQASSRNAEARRLFSQGMAQAYAFNAPEAVRSFKAALAADPTCALCAWGVAWQLGPNINAPDREDLSEARRHVAIAQRHAGQATPLEQALVEAMATRYGSPRDAITDGPPGAEICGPARDGRPRADGVHPLDLAYADRLRALADRLPDDADVLSFYAEAELVATREDWWDEKTGKPAGRVGELADRLERALRVHPGHTGLNHYMVHTLDASTSAARATAAADRLGALAPNSPHLLHMPAHIYVKVGRFDDAVRVNQQALAAEVALTARLKDQQLEPVWNWDRHNLHFLWFAALMRDDGALAVDTARRVATLAAEGKSPYAEYRRALPLLTLARLQRWDEVLKEPPVSDKHGLATAMTLALQGLALAHTGQVAAAREKAVALQAAIAAAKPAPGARPTELNAAASPIAVTLEAWLQAELALRDNRLDDVRAAYTRATAAEDELGGEPPILGAGSRLALGRALLRAQRWTEAEAAFKDDLRLHPANAFGTAGLAQAMQGLKTQAVLRRAPGRQAG